MIRRPLRARAHLTGAALLVSLAWPQAGYAQLHGRILHAGTGDGIAGAAVRLVGASPRLATTASDGSYRFDGLAPGEHCMAVDHPTFDSARVCALLGSAPVRVDVPLRIRPLVLNALVVRGGRDSASAADSVVDLLRTVPYVRTPQERLLLLGSRSGRALGGALVGDMAATQGRDAIGGARRHALYLWGSSAERGRVLLDGASVNAPLHLGSLLPPVDPDVLAGAALHTGGISPRYDGGAAYIVEYTTRPGAPDGGVWGEADLLTARVGAEVGWDGGARVLASARRVNPETIEGVLSPEFGYGYRDALVRADVPAGAGTLHATVFHTGERVDIPRDQGRDRADWDNRALLLEWRADAGAGTRAVQASISRGVADLPLLSAVGGHTLAGLARGSLLGRRRWEAGRQSFEVGVEAERLRFWRESRATVDPNTGAEGPVRCVRGLSCAEATTTLGSVFGEAGFAGRGWDVVLGMRGTLDPTTARAHVLPRAMATLVAAEGLALRASAGRFSQVEAREHGGRLELVVTRAMHYEASLTQRAGGLSVDARAFLRRHSGGSTLGDTPGVEVGAGWAGEHGTFTAAWTVGRLASANAQASRRIQQLVGAGYEGRFRRLLVDVTAAWGTGIPITSIVLEQPEEFGTALQPSGGEGQPGGFADEPHLRLDGTAGFQFRVGSGLLVPYVRLVNALSQRDALFYFQDGNVGQPAQALARLPTVVTAGLRWSF